MYDFFNIMVDYSIDENCNGKINTFLKLVKDSVSFFDNNFNSKNKIKIVSHFDTDGISSCAILKKTFEKLNFKVEYEIVQVLDKDKIDELFLNVDKNNLENCQIVISDLGSNLISYIKEKLANFPNDLGIKILILDHHEIDSSIDADDYDKINQLSNNLSNLYFVNPHICGLCGSFDISASGVCYFFSKLSNSENVKLSYLGLLGAFGDRQEKNFELSELNKIILNDSQVNNIIKSEKDIRFHGVSKRPLFKILEYSNEIIIPDITGNKYNAMTFLSELGMLKNEDGSFLMYNSLSKEKKQVLADAIIKKRYGLKDAENIFGIRYLFVGENESGYSDMKSYSTIINSCSRSGRPDIAISLCLNEKYSREQAKEFLDSYKKQINDGLKFFDDNINSSSDDFVINGNFAKSPYVIIRAGNYISAEVIGSVTSFIAIDKNLKRGTIVVSISYKDNVAKISLRIAANNYEKRDVYSKYNLKDIIKSLVEELGTDNYGGHSNAAGAIIPIGLEDKFIKVCKDYFSNNDVKKD
jgi:single-stranded-DNA-specific exonuclease